MRRLATIEATYANIISNSAERFGDHEDISKGKVLHWMGQFDDEHLDLAGKVLIETKYYSSTNIRRMTQELVRAALDSSPEINPRKTVFIPVGDQGSSAAIISRVLRDLHRLGQMNGAKFAQMADLEKIEPRTVEAIVFVEDFSGTGDRLNEWWANVEQLVRPKRAKIIVALLVMNGRAKNRIEEFAKIALCIDELGDMSNVFSNHNKRFKKEEKDILLVYCERTLCSPEYLKGRGDCGLLLAFKHGCPNNSLPILWNMTRSWSPLFRRHAI